MTTTQKKQSPKKQGFTGIRSGLTVIICCLIIAVCIFKIIFGAPENFVGGDSNNAVLNGNLLGTIYKGGVVVPIIQTLLLTVIALSIERYFALRTAFGKGSLVKFVKNIKEALAANDIAKAQQICDKQKGSVANVVTSTLRKYDEMEKDTVLDRKSTRLNSS